MITLVEHYDALATAQYGLLKRTLTGATEEELDWRPHPEANSSRWILGHLLWYEHWVPDTILGTGRYLIDRDPLFFGIASLPELMERFDDAAKRRREVYDGITEDDLQREIDYLGRFSCSIARLVRTLRAILRAGSVALSP